MASKLVTFLQALSGDPAKLALFHADPSKAVQHAGLSASEIVAVTSKNPGSIAKAAKAAGDDVNVTIVVVVVP